MAKTIYTGRDGIWNHKNLEKRNLVEVVDFYQIWQWIGYSLGVIYTLTNSIMKYKNAMRTNSGVSYLVAKEFGRMYTM